MKCAIQLVFDEESQEKINNIRKILIENGVHDEAVKINHISIADIEINENEQLKIEKILFEFSKLHNKIKLSLASAGSFMSKENVLFFAPIMTEILINFNDEIVDLLKKEGIECGKYYTKNNWQPHCTISIRLSDDEIKKGFAVLKENNIIPLNVVAERIDLLRYDPKPYEEIVSFELK